MKVINFFLLIYKIKPRRWVKIWNLDKKKSQKKSQVKKESGQSYHRVDKNPTDKIPAFQSYPKSG